MLYITTSPANAEPEAWHIGEKFPRVFGKVVVFRADGDELAVITEAIRAASSEDILNEATARGVMARWKKEMGI